MAANQNKTRPLSKDQAPDPSDVYERADPNHEAGMGRLDNNIAVPADSPDCAEHAVDHRQPLRQINADDVVNAREQQAARGSAVKPGPARQD